MKAKEKRVQKVKSIFKKPHRASGKLTLSKRKLGEKKEGADKNKVFGENNQAESKEPTEGSKREKKRVRLTIGVKSEAGLEIKTKVPKWGGIKQRHGCGAASITLETARSGDGRGRSGTKLGPERLRSRAHVDGGGVEVESTGGVV